MNRSLQTLERRRNIADAAAGIPRVNVALYACLEEEAAVRPQQVFAALKEYAEARDWTVLPGATAYDMGSLETPRAARHTWPSLEALFRERQVSGLLVPDESHLAYTSGDRTGWRDWVGQLGVFVVCLPEALQGRPAA
ncbi:hypothetical protein [Streptomyces sp. ISL-94]|uniref:hypothetical protein n=1 Tax=Streptomyces sp. ISL-94 TaxID=2819190 RepID=UPI001BE8FA5B|nr:hypothetical protein [Streptomyces sp. ISL-94]MBT2479189.1 hypothetical protein [Streptomyces sp. ISL-94]